MNYRDKIDTDDIKAKHDIVDVIGKAVPLKKTGRNYSACCPFHSEKTPSFTVEPAKQFYFCFGCGASGDVIDFTVNYYGVEFIEACEMLGADIQKMPSKKVQANIEKNNNAVSYSVPIDHKQDIDKTTQFLKNCRKAGLLYADKDGYPHAPIINFQKQYVNVAHLESDHVTFLAGGVSYGAFTFINKHSKNNVAVSNYDVGVKIANKHNVNVFVCYSESNLKYVCDYAKPKDLKIKPVLWFGEDDSISLDIPCLWWDGIKLSKYEVEK